MFGKPIGLHLIITFNVQHTFRLDVARGVNRLLQIVFKKGESMPPIVFRFVKCLVLKKPENYPFFFCLLLLTYIYVHLRKY